MGVSLQRLLLTAACALVLAFLLPETVRAQRPRPPVGRLVSAEGRIEVRRAAQSQWQPVRMNDSFAAGDVVRVGVRSRADIALVTATVIRVDQNTTITFSEPENDDTSVLDLIRGALYFFTNKPRSLKVATPFVNGFVEGTEFYLRVDSDQAFLSVFKGRVALSNQSGSLSIGEGQSAAASANRAPELRIVVAPRDAVKWTLYYPPILSCAPDDFAASPAPLRAQVEKAVDAGRSGEVDRAVAAIDAVAESATDPRLLTCRASLLFRVGRFDEAEAALDKALGQSPGYSTALAMKAVVSLVQNDRADARAFAARATEADPQSVPSLIALSYVRQADSDLAGAIAAAAVASGLDPSNAIAWTRIGELKLSSGHFDEALEAAERATKVDPRGHGAETVLGFSLLSQMKPKEAARAFEGAIRTDQADPLPRLGLGLAAINEGRLAEGREQIEIAASLDPQNSLVRSYLGKAYYEEKREPQAAEQFALAKRLDPSDPTPYLYDAILKQSINRPVEALDDLQKSAELNDRRSVYRSRLLLDEDLAVRSVSLARIYGDLGFDQAALAEGWKSVNLDPANYSAHRFLADSYAALPRHEIARVSELLQSQLLQPLNINPVQPSLAQSSSLFLGGGGPADPSFNEYTPLFNRNRLALLAGGMGGENGTWGEELIQSGVWGRWSYSVGQLHQQTDGFRENSDVKSDVVNLFGQARLAHNTGLQVEVRSERTERGDTEARFFPWDYLPNMRYKEESSSARLGFHHSPDPGSDLIVSLTYRHYEPTLKDHDPFFPFVYETKEDGVIGEAQYIYRKERFNLAAGGGYAGIDRRDTRIDVSKVDPKYILQSRTDANISHTNLYLYSQINWPPSLTVTIGGSGDFLEGALSNASQFNPKLGLVWKPLDATTLRGAVFRTLKRTLITSQTIEPTQVAGFNQFFDDAEATSAWNYGAGLDQRFTRSLYGGLSYFWRDLEVPFEHYRLTGGVPPVPVFYVKSVDWKEQTGRAYLYWAPHRLLALTAEYLYEKFDRDTQFGAGVEEVRTQRVPFGLSFFHPMGIIGKVRATFVDQKGKFRPRFKLLQTDPSIDGEDTFWVVDASLSYRLPKRYGMITVGVRNLFDQSFRYQDMDPFNPRLQPGRFAYARLTLAF